MAGKRGRPSVYTQAAADRVCEGLAQGMSLREICRGQGMPTEGAVRGWIIDDREGFASHYARAKEAGLERMAEEILEISDDGSNDWMERQVAEGVREAIVDHEHIARSKLRVDTRRWLLSKLLPKKYGDRIDVNANVNVSHEDALTDLTGETPSRG